MSEMRTMEVSTYCRVCQTDMTYILTVGLKISVPKRKRLFYWTKNLNTVPKEILDLPWGCENSTVIEIVKQNRSTWHKTKDVRTKWRTLKRFLQAKYNVVAKLIVVEYLLLRRNIKIGGKDSQRSQHEICLAWSEKCWMAWLSQKWTAKKQRIDSWTLLR